MATERNGGDIMYTLNSITFKDDRTNKIIEVHPDGKVTANEPLTQDDYTTCSLYTGLLLGGGMPALLDYLSRVKK